MDSQQQRQPDLQDDPLLDPNLQLAVAMVKSISVTSPHYQPLQQLIESGNAESLAQEEAAKADKKVPQHQEAAPPKVEVILISPVDELAEKLRQKTLLNREEVNLISTTLSTQFGNDTKRFLNPVQADALREILWLTYYAILNVQPYTTGNYLESQAMSKLIKDTFVLIKQILEILAPKKKDAAQLDTLGNHQVANLLNVFLPPALKILSLFESSSKDFYDQQHYKYLRVTSLRLNTLSIGFLNQVFTDMAPHLFGPNKKTKAEVAPVKVRKDNDMIPLQQMQVKLDSTDEEFMMSMLEFVPQDYQAMAKSLNDQVQVHTEKDDETMSNIDLDMDQSQIESLSASIKDHIHKQKILVLTGKAIDRLVTLSMNESPTDFFLRLNTDLFQVISKSLGLVSALKPKLYAQLIDGSLSDKAQIAQGAIIDHFGKQKDIDTIMAMNIDTVMESVHGIEDQRKELHNHVQMLAKCLQVVQRGPTEGRISISQLVDNSQNLRYLTNLIKYDKKGALTKMLQSIVHSFCGHLKLTLREDQPKSPEQALELITNVTRLILASRMFKGEIFSKDAQNSGEEFKQLLPASTQLTLSYSDTSSKGPSIVRTRGQMKKEQEGTSASKDQGKKESKVTFQVPKPMEAPPIIFTGVDSNDLLKFSLSLLTQVLPLYFKNTPSMTINLISNLYSLASNQSELTGKLVYGMLSEFSRPGIQYTPESIGVITSFIRRKIGKITQSLTQTVFTTKLMFLISNKKVAGHDDQIALDIAQELVGGQWLTKKGTMAKTQSEITEAKNIAKYLLFISSIFMISSNGDKSLEQKKALIESLTKDLNTERLIVNLNLLQITLLNPSAIGKFKQVLQKFLTQVYNDSEADSVTVVSDMDKIVHSVLTSQEQIFDVSLLSYVEESLLIETMLERLRSQQFKTQSELKVQVNSVLKQVVKINSEIRPQERDSIGSTDLETYIAMQMSEGSTVLELLHSRFELSSSNQIQTIVQKVKSLNALTDEEHQFLNAQLKSLQYLSANMEAESLEIIKVQVRQLGAPEGLASLVYESTKGYQQSQRLQKLQQQAINVSLPGQTCNLEMIQMILDPQFMAKQISSLKSHSYRQEESIYSHCFSAGIGHPDMENLQAKQQMISQCILFHTIFTNLFRFINACGDQQDAQSQDLVHEVSFSLLNLKYEHPFVEYSESGSHSYDNDLNDKLLVKALANQAAPLVTLHNRDFIRLRNIDSTLNCIQITQTFLSNPATHNFAAIVNEMASNVFQFSSFKSQGDLKIMNAIFQIEEGPLQVFFKNSMKCLMNDKEILPSLWIQAFKYLQYSSFENESEELLREKKGGIQMNIGFAPEGRRGRGKPLHLSSAAKRGSAQKSSAEQQIPQDEHIEEPSQKKERQINMVAHKILTFLSDVVQTDKNSSPEHNLLSQHIKKALLQSGNQGGDFMHILYETKQVPFLKRLISGLLKTEGDSSIKQQLQEFLYKSLVNLVTTEAANQSDDDRNAIIIAIEIANIITDSNKQLLQFISEQILSHSQNADGTNSLTRLFILDFLCQLTQSKFSTIDNEISKYSQSQIQESRKQSQDDRKQQIEKQKLIASQQVVEVNDESGTLQIQQSQDTQIDGYKQDKVNKEQDYMKYMEKPEDVCTYSYTKKEFKIQHWYFCYTCRLTDNSGCCAVCARKCHKGHIVVYSKKSNFFCDCGDSGRCQSISQPGAPAQQFNPNPYSSSGVPFDAFNRPPSQKRGAQGNPFIQERSMQMKPPPSGGLFYQPPQASNQPSFGQPRMFQNSMFGGEHQFIAEQDIMFKPIGGGPPAGFDPSQIPPNILKHLGGPAGMRFLDESSEEEIVLRDYIPQTHLRMDGDDDESDDPDIQRDPASNKWGGIKNMMKFIKKVPQKMAAESALHIFNRQGGPIPKKPSSPHSLSNISNVNPFEDPFSDAGAQTPVYDQNDTDQFGVFSSNQPEDVTMTQPIEEVSTSPELVEMLKKERHHFESIFNHLLSLIDNQSDMMTIDEKADQKPNNASGSKSKQAGSLIGPKQSVTLVQDLALNKKIFKESTFQMKPFSDISKAATSQNINLLNMADSNKDGLIAVCEDQDVTFYSGSQFFEEQVQNHDSSLEQFTLTSKEGATLQRIESMKLSFSPQQVKFNPIQPCYLAVVGAQNVEVVVVNRHGKIQYKVSIELLLEAISKDMTITNVHWLPGSQTAIAVATRDFIKIYDLAEDTMSPTHNIMIFNGFISDFTFSQRVPSSEGINQAATTIFAASKAGAVYFQEITYKMNSFDSKISQEEKMSIDQDNSDLMLTEPLIFDPSFNIVENDIECLAVHITSQDLLLITFSGGLTLFGRKDPNTSDFHGCKLNVSEDSSYNGSSLKTVWQKFGESIVCFKELGFASKGESKLYLTAFSRKRGQQPNLCGIPLLLEISESKVQVNIVKNSLIGSSNGAIVPVFGQTYVKKSCRGSQSMRLVNFMFDGSAASYSCKSLESDQSEESKSLSNDQQQIRSALGNVDLLIARSDLPKEVKMSISFFEKSKNIFLDNNLKPKLQFSGDIISYHKKSKETFEALSKQSNQVVINEPAKKSIKFQLKLDPISDHLIIGLRVKIDFSGNRQQQACPSIKLFNRVVKLKNYQSNGGMAPIWFEVPFCDAEVIFGSATLNNMQMEFLTEDPKNCPLRICAMEIFALSKKDFGYKDKIRKLEKVNQEKLNKMNPLSVTSSDQSKSDLSIKEELNKTKGVPLVSWKEKISYLKSNVDQQSIELIETLDIITQYISITQQMDRDVSIGLIDKLKGLLFKSIINNQEEDLLQASIKRCLRGILKSLSLQSALGDPFNYSTIKDQVLVNAISNRLESPDLTLTEVRSYIKSMTNIYNKRHFQMFKIIEGNQDLIKNIMSHYIRLYKSSLDQKEALKDIQELVSLVIALYHQKLNQNEGELLKNSSSIEAAIENVYKEDSLIQVFDLLKPLLIHDDDQVQKITISTILNMITKYSRSMAKQIKLNKVPLVVYSCANALQQYEQKTINLLIVDFTPHLLKYMFSLLNGQTQIGTPSDIAYQVTYKLIKTLENSCIRLYNGKFMDHLVLPIVNFICTTLTSINGSNLAITGDAPNISADKLLYANIVLANILMQKAMKDTDMKIKGSKLGLESSTQKLVIEAISGNSQAVVNYVEWISSVLKAYDSAYKSQKCSFRTKIEEGIPGSVYEVHSENGQEQGARKLLRPIQESVSWKWHPLFLQSDSQFELLDRKVPAQLLLSIQFIHGNCDTLEKYEQSSGKVTQLINVIRELSLKKPAKTFLKRIGEQSIRSLLSAIYRASPKFQEIDTILKTQIKGCVAFEEFSEVYETLYCKNLVKRGSQLSFNLQFLLHAILQKTWKKACNNPESWQYFINESNPSRVNLVQYLLQSAFILNDDSAQLCLQLCALAFDQSTLMSFKAIDHIQVNLFSVFARSTSKQTLSTQTLHYDLPKLVDVMLLGRNKKQLRVGAAHLLKGIYDKVNGQQSQIKDFLIQKIPELRTKGVNSLEFIALLSYIINKEIEVKGISIDEKLYSRITREIYKDVSRSNQQLTAHENLDVYASLQRMTSVFSSASEISVGNEDDFLKKLNALEQDSASLFGGKQAYLEGGPRGSKITNPYMLESEACQKCYSQRSLPFALHRLNELKTEAKYSDSTMIYRFNNTYMLKQIQITQEAFRGNKVIKEIHIYINNKQGVDLADMKNNWNHWKKVKTQEVDPAQQKINIDFTLPITASNLLLDFHTVNIAKIMNPKEKGGERGYSKHPKPVKEKSVESKIQSIHQVKGIDSVLMTLPKSIAGKLGIISENEKDDSQNRDENGTVIDKDQVVCPRCSKQVQGKHGICNQCGENALQCTYCRNINYEKPDGFLCNECGFSRYVKMEFAFVAKQGFATEKIETEEAKSQAMNQIEINLQGAQSSYSQLMKKRSMIASLIKRMNENGGEGAKMITDMYQEECSDLYQKMMKSLNSIKILKIELDQYTQGGQVIVEESKEEVNQSEKLAIVLSRSSSSISTNDDQNATECCFSCIQEYLKGLLNFIQVTSDKLSIHYKAQGFIDLLYKENTKMYTSVLQDPARKAICMLLKTDEVQTKSLLKQIQTDIFSKRLIIPSHQLAQNINQETYLILDMLKLQQLLRGKESTAPSQLHQTILESFWVILFQALVEGANNSAISDQVAGSFFAQIRELIKAQPLDQSGKEMNDLLISLFDPSTSSSISSFHKAQDETLKGSNFLIYSLTLGSSQRVRNEAKEIISLIISNNKSLQAEIVKQLLSVLEKVLKLESSSGDQYFDLLAQILSPATIKEQITEQSLQKGTASHIYVEAFDLLFKQIDSELNKLVSQEYQRLSLGADGFMPKISTGQIFARIVSLVSSMIKESAHLKGIIQNNVSIVIKSFLKIKKLNLTKNKVIQTSEVEIEKMFKELRSNQEGERENFILECIKIIETGECDFQELRFLFEEMCKVIDPVKPEPEYLLNLQGARSQEFYFRGKMSKNPYLSSQLGKTMADVRIKICKEMELAEPELVELLVANKLVGMDLPIKHVYEQVLWPDFCKQKNPDIYDIPPIDDVPKTGLPPMIVTFRLMGIDGEATEDRVESLQDGSEGDLDPANIQKKFGITQALCKEFDSRREPGTKVSGVKVLLEVLEHFGGLQKQRYLAEWLFKMIGFALKIKSNRIEFMKYTQTVDHLAKRLFESVGMNSQMEGQKGQTLFDFILGILDQIIVEVNQSEDPSLQNSEERMVVDQKPENRESATHVQIFIQIMSDSCNEMLASHQGLDKTQKKIKAVSKILPFLINNEDKQAQQIIIDFIAESLTKIPLLDQLAQMTAREKFVAQFNIDRVIEILESTPVTKNYLKDQIISNCGQLLESMWTYLMTTTLADVSNESTVYKHKLANQYILKVIHSLLKNHVLSQTALYNSNRALIDKLYELAQAKHKDRQIMLLAQDVIESLTNKNLINDPSVKEHLQKLIDQQNEEKKKLAQRKKEEIMKQMAMKKTQNKFMKQIETVSMQEETGPKCIVCLDGYTKKPTEILGMYVFSKKAKISEMSQSGSGFTNTLGYTTVTHSNFIHFTCHQNAYRADSQLKQPKKEWEGAGIRNDHTKCNNLFPLRGGSLPIETYGQMVERYFQIMVKSAGTCDPDRVKVMQHDFKFIMKRLAYEDSFSRDTHGGGPEHNMHLIPFMIPMMHYLLSVSPHSMSPERGTEQSVDCTYLQEKKIADFLDQGMKLKKDFLLRLEEEKRAIEIEEDEKQSVDDEDSQINQDEGFDEGGQMSDFSLDQIAHMISQCVIFCQMPRWENYKPKFISIILCTVANMREDKGTAVMKPAGPQTDLATGKRVLTIAKAEDVLMTSSTEGLGGLGMAGEPRRARIGSDNKAEVVNRAMARLRPLLLLMRLVDSIKQRWDAKRLGIIGNTESSVIKHDEYLNRLMNQFIAKGNLQEVIGECDDLFREYKDRMLKISSVEEFFQEMGLLESIVANAPGMSISQALEQYIMSHFQY